MKGLSYTIEAVIAIVIIVMAAVAMLSTGSASIDSDKADAYAKLQYLSTFPELREYVYEDNEERINQMLSEQFSDYDFNICKPDCGGPNLMAQETIILDWNFAGYRSDNQPRTLRVYVFG